MASDKEIRCRPVGLPEDLADDLGARIGLRTEPDVELAKAVATFALQFVPTDKPYGTKLFDALNKMEPHFAFEGVLLRDNSENGQIEVYLMKRREDDTAYPGEFHCPGSAVQNGEDWWSVAHRLGKGEFKTGVKMIAPLHEASFWYQEARGWYYSLPVVVELETEPAEGKWYPVGNLPEKMVHHHRHQVIPCAVSYWKSQELYEAGQYMCRLSLGLEQNDPERTRSAIAAALDLKDPKTPMGTEMYDAFTPHATNIAAEGVAFRTCEDGTIEVLMEQRPEEDKWFSKQWAGLGVGFRNTDKGRGSVLDRLVAKEFKVPTKFEFVGDVYPPDTGRGWYECKLFLAFPESQPANGQWFPADPLPPDTENFVVVEGHRNVIIPMALAAYKKKMEENRH